MFVDRDGVLNRYLPGRYVQTPDELVVLPGVPQAVRRLNDAHIPVVVISNQQGVGKGLMTEMDLMRVEQRLAHVLKAEAGAHLDACLYCTDLKSANSPRRKPAPGMLTEAAERFKLDLSRTVFVGDSATDMEAGRAAGVGTTLLVLCGSVTTYHAGDMAPAPDFVFADLPAAVHWILASS